MYYRDYVGKIWRNSKIHDCQPILENYRHWLLKVLRWLQMLALIAGLYKSKQIAFFFLFGTRVFFKYFWQSWLLVEASGVEWASGYLCHVIEGVMRTALFPRHFTLVRAFSFSRTIRSNRGTIQIIERSLLEALMVEIVTSALTKYTKSAGESPLLSLSCYFILGAIRFEA